MADARLHIAHVVLGLEIGGLEMVVANIIRAASSRATHRHSVYCLDTTGGLAKHVEALGAPVTLVPRREPFDATLALRLARLARRHDVDVLHAHNFTPFTYASLSRLFSPRLRVIATFHNTRLASSSPRRVAAMKALCRLTASVVAVSEQTKAVIESFIGRTGRVRPVCIPNGVAVNQFRRATDGERDALLRELGLPANARIVGSVGRLSPEKDYATLIRAFDRLRKSDTAVRLVIAGDGPERASLQELVTSLGISDETRLLGSRHDVARLLSVFDVFALSSLTEGTSVALLEAMASQAPIVATRVGGTIDLIADGLNGVLVGSGQVAATADAIGSVLSDRDRANALARRARDTIVSEYSVERMERAYAALYQDAAETPRHGGVPVSAGHS